MTEYSPIAKGVVECFDENNNLLFTRNNMIVKTGRAKILSSVFSSNLVRTDKVFAILSGDSKVTTPEMTFENINAIVSCSTNVSDIITSDNNLYQSFEITKEAGADNTSINSLCLCFQEDDSRNVLFSRVTFPPYPNTAKLKFIYKIYF